MMRIEISLRGVFAAQRAQALKALLLLACGLVAAGLIVWRSARRLGAPITSLADAARRLTRGELPASIPVTADGEIRSEEHTSELQSLMRISYAVFCLKKKKRHKYMK